MAITVGGAMLVMGGLQLGAQVFGFLKTRSKKKKMLKKLRQLKLQSAMRQQQMLSQFQGVNRGRAGGISNMFLRPSGINPQNMGGYGPSPQGFYPPMMGRY